MAVVAIGAGLWADRFRAATADVAKLAAGAGRTAGGSGGCAGGAAPRSRRAHAAAPPVAAPATTTDPGRVTISAVGLVDPE